MKSTENLISDEAYEKYIHQHIGRFDGKNTEKIANQLMNLLEKIQETKN